MPVPFAPEKTGRLSVRGLPLMAAEAALVAEELGKIVSAQQIFVLRKAIYRLTAHSTNPHAVLCAHLPLRSASGALRQSTTYSHSPVWYPLRSARGALRQRPCRLCSQAYR